MKNCFFFLLVFSFIVLTVPMVNASESHRVNILEEQNIEQKIQQLSEEWQRHFVEAVNHFLEKELDRLKKNKKEPQENLGGDIEKYEEEVRRGSKDPDTFFSLARLYDQKADGANAIINAKKAEALFVAKKNVKGAAEVRRSLRHYLEKYDYKPEDFELAQ